MGAWRTAAGGTVAQATDVPRSDDRTLLHPRQRALLTDLPDHVEHVVVVAPTGHGKTALLAQHVRAVRTAGLPAAWLTLGPRCTDVGQLWEDLAAAVLDGSSPAGVPAPRPGRSRARGTPPGVAELLAATVRPASADASPRARWQRLVATLDDQAPPLTLVLDEAGEVVAPDVLAALAALTAVRTRVRVVWVGRREPPVGLAGPRLEGRVLDVGAVALALRPDEVLRVLARNRDVDASEVGDDEVRDALARTRGWPVAVALLDRPDQLADYVVEEVLAGLGEDEVELLRRTSVVAVLPVDLAVRLSGRQEAGAVLNALHRTTGLLERSPGEEGVYRTHPVVRQVLLEQLHERGSDACHDSHAVASRWFGETGEHWAAVEHAAAAGDGKLLQRTLLAHGLGVLLTGRADRLRALLEARAGRSRTAVEVVHHALAALDEGDVPAADALLVHARTLRHGGGWAGRLEDLFRCLLLQRARSATGPVPDEVLALVVELRDPARREELDIDVALHVMVDLGGYSSFEGDHDTACRYLEQARSLAELYGYQELALRCLVGLAGAELARSGLRAAREHAERAVEAATAHGRGDSPRLAFAHTVVAWSAHQQLDDELATVSAARSVAALDGTVDPFTRAAVRGCEALVAFAAGDRHAALLRLQGLVSGLVPGQADPTIAAHLLPRTLRLCLQQGEWTWAQECLELTDAILPGTGEAVLAHALWARARHREDVARRALADAWRPGTRCEVTDTRLELHLLRAVLLEQVGDRGGAHESLVQALREAEPDRMVRPFADARPSLLPHLVAASGRVGDLEPWRAHVTDVIRRRCSDLDPGPDPSGLTPREMAVLADLPSLLPLSAIAGQHHVSPNTLKTQVKAIYRKLEVSSRHEAVTVARLRGLLPS
ncbi:LuxR C-terminal-related transcriptional regulator [Aquipuribacter sp. MA13-6]|uniref:LuxR C-terminal-related transcriptional regulator n=1 Tax=unclassified Aquipuribacter TaxID=2635084 RepID=UPI003EEECD57